LKEVALAGMDFTASKGRERGGCAGKESSKNSLWNLESEAGRNGDRRNCAFSFFVLKTRLIDGVESSTFAKKNTLSSVFIHGILCVQHEYASIIDPTSFSTVRSRC
jgi:hypothetical protein